MQEEICDIKFKSKYVIVTTLISDILVIFGYFTSIYAYQCFDQPGLVNATESSLSLLVNLFASFSMKKFFNLGKDESTNVYIFYIEYRNKGIFLSFNYSWSIPF